MSIFNLVKELDNKIGLLQSEVEKNDMQLDMLLIECKYNLDLLDLLNFDIMRNDDPQIRSVIMLLSNTALESLILKGAYKSDSLFMNISKDLFGAIKFIFDDEPQIKNDDPLLFNLYKRITVLKAIVSIEPPYSALHEIKYNIRLKNLKKILLEINSKILLNNNGNIK
jgi:hypothetical protein